eukprot:TRINITY_DN62854_c0_g1_i1.p1 TRINITY_DN62854_c0_g1~~TRINITY_DN62854_c0_g1_i1.p1  ORF type:complete len:257 (-),score=51.70 TRINITY_DN62854_c0_g1_i1:129-899(-)
MAMYITAQSTSSVSVAAAPVPLGQSTRGLHTPLPAPPQAPPPAALTNGLLAPPEVETQKHNHVSNLDQQLKEGAESLSKQMKEQKEQVRNQADQHKALFALQVDQEMRLAEVHVNHVFASQVRELKRQSVQQRAILEQKALQLSIEFQGRKAEEDMLQQHHQLYKESVSLQEHLRSLPNLSAPFCKNSLLGSVACGVLPNGTPSPSYTPSPLSMTVPRITSAMVEPPTILPPTLNGSVQTLSTTTSMVPVTASYLA